MLRGAAVGGVALPLLAACGGGSDGGSGAGGRPARRLGRLGRRRRRRGRRSPRPTCRWAAARSSPTRRSWSPSRRRATSRRSPRSAPTRAAPVDQGRGRPIICPCHGSQFSIKDGSPVAGPGSRPALAVEEGLRRRAARSSGQPEPARLAQPLVAAAVPPVEPPVDERAAPRRTGRRAAARRSGSPRPPRAGRRCRRPATAAAASAASASAAPDASPSTSRRSARASGSGHLDVRRVVARRRSERASVASPAASSAAHSATAACSAMNGRRRRASRVVVDDARAPRRCRARRVLPGVSAQRHSSEPGVDQAAAAQPGLGAQLGVVAAPDRVEVAQRQLVHRGVPREVAEAVDARRRRR